MSQNVPCKKTQAIHLLLTGIPSAEVCARMGISRKTLWRWRKQPEFKKTMQILMDEVCEELRLRMFQLVHLSLDELSDHFHHSRDGKTCAKIALDILKIAAQSTLLPPPPPIYPVISLPDVRDGTAEPLTHPPSGS
jgi:hypothetical protein